MKTDGGSVAAQGAAYRIVGVVVHIASVVRIAIAAVQLVALLEQFQLKNITFVLEFPFPFKGLFVVHYRHGLAGAADDRCGGVAVGVGRCGGVAWTGAILLSGHIAAFNRHRVV